MEMEHQTMKRYSVRDLLFLLITNYRSVFREFPTLTVQTQKYFVDFINTRLKPPCFMTFCKEGANSNIVNKML